MKPTQDHMVMARTWAACHGRASDDKLVEAYAHGLAAADEAHRRQGWLQLLAAANSVLGIDSSRQEVFALAPLADALIEHHIEREQGRDVAPQWIRDNALSQWDEWKARGSPGTWGGFLGDALAASQATEGRPAARRRRFLADVDRADMPEGATVELCTPDTTQNAHDWGLWWWSLGEAHGGHWDGHASSEADALWTAFHVDDALSGLHGGGASG